MALQRALNIVSYLDSNHSNVAVTSVVFSRRITGFSVWGHPVDAQKCIMLSFSLLCLLINTSAIIMQTKYNANTARDEN